MSKYSNDISFNEMRYIAHDICDEVCNEEKIVVNLNPITLVEYYKSDVFKRNIKLTSFNGMMDTLKLPLLCNGVSFK